MVEIVLCDLSNILNATRKFLVLLRWFTAMVTYTWQDLSFRGKQHNSFSTFQTPLKMSIAVCGGVSARGLFGTWSKTSWKVI